MVSLTPQSERDGVTLSATQEGLINASLAAIPSVGGVWLAMRSSKSFLTWTNWQSRTAIAIMPPLFIFAATAERALESNMRDMAARNEHIRSTAVWAEKKHAQNIASIDIKDTRALSNANTEAQLMELYRESVQNSGVRIVPGNSLGAHHKFANYWQENPIKVLACVGVPAVAYIFYGRSGQALQFQMKVMHTRVLGQATVLTMLLGLMGFKSYMDANGKFITQAEADQRVAEMAVVRQDLLKRLDIEKQGKAAFEKARLKARENDEASGNLHTHTAMRKARRKTAAKEVDTITDA